MTNYSSIFLAKSTVKAADKEHRRKINFNIGKYNDSVPHGKSQFVDLQKVRELAKNTKWKAIEHLDQHLESFEKQISARGAKVLWAQDASEALLYIGSICKEKNCKKRAKYTHEFEAEDDDSIAILCADHAKNIPGTYVAKGVL